MKVTLVFIVSLLVFLEASVAQDGHRQPPRSRFNFGPLQPIVNAMFPRPTRYQRPPPPHRPVAPKPPTSRPPPAPVMKPPTITHQQYFDGPKKVPSVPFPPPPPPNHLLHDVSFASLEEGFGTPRPNSILQTSSSLNEENVESFSRVKSNESKNIVLEPIHETIYLSSLPQKSRLSDGFIPITQFQARPASIQQFSDGKALNSAPDFMSLTSAELNPAAIFPFANETPLFLDAEPLKPNTIIQTEANNQNIDFVSNIKGMRPPPSIKDVRPVKDIQFVEFEPVQEIQLKEIKPVQVIQFQKFTPVIDTNFQKFRPSHETQFSELKPDSEPQFLEFQPVQIQQIQDFLPEQEMKLEEFKPIQEIQFHENIPIQEIQFQKFTPVRETQFQKFTPVRGTQFQEFKPLQVTQLQGFIPSQEILFEELNPTPGIQLPFTTDEFELSPFTKPETPADFFEVPDYESNLNDVDFIFSDSLPTLNAGVLPLANELPEQLQKFPPFI